MSNNLELRGTVHKIEETQTFESGFQKRTLVINNGEQYRPYIAIDFLKTELIYSTNSKKVIRLRYQ